MIDIDSRYIIIVIVVPYLQYYSKGFGEINHIFNWKLNGYKFKYVYKIIRFIN